MVNRSARSLLSHRVLAWIVGIACAVAWTGYAAETNWWAFAPLRQFATPTGQNEIDFFISQKLAEKNILPNTALDRRALIRRASFDLTGLPPSPEEVEAFVRDTDPKAFERLIDRLLASPRYGEKWARHWLDVVHFGETHGYDKDKPRLNAWPYRDYVIRSFNNNKPYARFIEEQIAGDVLFPGSRDGIEALGFLSAGPWDFIGHEEVPETKIDGKVARHLDRDDIVMNTMQSFTSLTVHCAQCHKHKFDPITQEDYYSLQAVFAALDRTDKKYDIDPAVAENRTRLRGKEKGLLADLASVEASVRARAGEPLVEMEKAITELEKKRTTSEAFGYHSAIATDQMTAKWVQLDFQKAQTIQEISLHPCKDDFNNIGEGFGFPIRYKVELSNDPEFGADVFIVQDRTKEDFANPKIAAQVIAITNTQAFRFCRITATKLAPRQNDFIMALAEVRVMDKSTNNLAVSASISALDSIEAAPRWQKQNLIDGWYPGIKNFEPVGLAELQEKKASLLAASTTPEDRSRTEALNGELKIVRTDLANLPKESIVYAGTAHTGKGNFAGTGGKPRPIFLLARGNVQKPGREMVPGTLSVIAGQPSRFDLPPDHKEGDRRAALARWISAPENVVTWRSIVNRVWQYHFGQGLVETPNDFGKMGSAPTQPELLDWMAGWFLSEGGSLKSLHRKIMLSDAYQRSSEISNKGAVELDESNKLYWRGNRRKLEAEELRDSILAAAGKLDLKMGGPSFQDFVVEKPEHSPHYQFHLADPENPALQRRSIYRFLVRSQPQPFMAALDCADPSMQVGKRNESQSALQALVLLNDQLTVAMARHLATRFSGKTVPEQINQIWLTALGRGPSAKELAELTAFAEQHGMENLCRVVFNLNEFVFVD